MRVLVGCEFSGIVREAFASRGHDAWSCDLLESEQAGQHIQGNILAILDQGWDLAIFHPPCTYLANSGARWWAKRQEEQQQALAFVRHLLDAPIPRKALENPEGRISTAIRRPTQIIHPWEYGEEEEKKTHLWLINLPCLQPTKIMAKREQRTWRQPQSFDRWKKRSRTFPGIAHAMAAQWGIF